MPYLGLTTLLVHDYDEAIAFYVGKLGFALHEDTPLSAEKRWVVVSPGGDRAGGLLLARAADEGQRRAVGAQAGGRVFLFLSTDEFWRDYDAFRANGVEFEGEPRREPYGTVVVFRDPYGNRWDLIQPSPRPGLEGKNPHAGPLLTTSDPTRSPPRDRGR